MAEFVAVSAQEVAANGRERGLRFPLLVIIWNLRSETNPG